MYQLLNTNFVQTVAIVMTTLIVQKIQNMLVHLFVKK